MRYIVKYLPSFHRKRTRQSQGSQHEVTSHTDLTFTIWPILHVSYTGSDLILTYIYHFSPLSFISHVFVFSVMPVYIMYIYNVFFLDVYNCYCDYYIITIGISHEKS